MKKRIRIGFITLIFTAVMAGGAPNKWTPPGTCSGPEEYAVFERYISQMVRDEAPVAPSLADR